jgi:hypothetical protein
MLLGKPRMGASRQDGTLGCGCWVGPCAVALLGGVMLWSRPAAASCSGLEPSRELVFSYPDATTASVPANAVFWAVGTTGPVARVLLDGVELSRLGRAPHELVQFVSPAPLALGPHELAIIVPTDPQYSDDDTPIPTATFRFDATEPGSFEADGEIVSLKTYPTLHNPRLSPHPPEEAFEGDCSDRAIDLAPGCYDIIPPAMVRLELAPDPRARGYIMSNYLLPADCAVFFPYPYAQPSDTPYSVAAILPTGLGGEVPFEGTAQRIEYEPPPGTYRDGPPGWCALSFGVRSPAHVGSIAALAGALALLGRRRARSLGR